MNAAATTTIRHKSDPLRFHDRPAGPAYLRLLRSGVQPAARGPQRGGTVVALGGSLPRHVGRLRGTILGEQGAEQTGADAADLHPAGAGVVAGVDLHGQTGLGGLHHFVGIPSTVGGAIWQNLHFLSPPPERERTVFVEEVVEACELLTAEGERTSVGVDYLAFGYDYSILHDRPDVVLAVTFRLRPTPQEELLRVIRENLQWRDDRHPDLWLYPSAGSIFKKIEGVGAGRLIDECGLKGHVHGSAQIFHRHANIIVNLGGATARQVRELIALAQDTVDRELGYRLEPEIGFIGEF